MCKCIKMHSDHSFRPSYQLSTSVISIVISGKTHIATCQHIRIKCIRITYRCTLISFNQSQIITADTPCDNVSQHWPAVPSSSAGLCAEWQSGFPAEPAGYRTWTSLPLRQSASHGCRSHLVVEQQRGPQGQSDHTWPDTTTVWLSLPARQSQTEAMKQQFLYLHLFQDSPMFPNCILRWFSNW